MSDEVEREDAAPAVPPSHRDLLERPLYACLATVREDGAPLANPMWFLWEPGSGVLLFTHTTTRHNYRNVRREPRVAVLISDPKSRCATSRSTGASKRSRRTPPARSTSSSSSGTTGGWVRWASARRGL